MRLFPVLVTATALLSAQQFDIVIHGGRVMDPESGLDAVRDVGIRGSKVAVISTKSLKGKRQIDAKGLVVAPGFIDLHQHGQTPENYRLKARDGVTTALELEIGVSPVKDWIAAREGKTLVNFGASAGYIPARMVVMKDTGAFLPRDKAITEITTADDRGAILKIIDRDLSDGGLGLGFGFNYTPKAGHDELEDVFWLAAKWNRPSFIHMRYGSMGDPGLLASLHEVIAYAAVTGAPVHVVHYGASSTVNFDKGIRTVEGARKHGIDITLEAYPYTAGMTRIETAIFDEGWEKRLGIGPQDMLWAETGERLTPETFAKYRKTGGWVATFTNTEEMIRKNMAHPWIMIASDGILENGKGHPRVSGTYARVLGRYVREQKALTLMEAIRKMSLMPAQRLEKMSPAMRAKGRVRVGADADLSLFDPNTVIDKSDYSKPDTPSEGIPYVLVNGVVVVDQSKVVDGVLPGHPVRAK
ncbi:MAG: amidohydrolase family protein [Bryobacteraceae bacterium]